MSYKPRPESDYIIGRAKYWVESVDYDVTARWVFYRLLQDGTYSEKKDYKHLLALLSKARKEFYAGWTPYSLADYTRAPVLMQRSGYYGLYLRGYGFKDEKEWLKAIKEELNCPLNRWESQPVYAEIWFEAAAMQGQFLHYANENIPLLAFHGDISIPEKWRTAERLAQRYYALRKPIHIYYFGDLDPKGLTIPQSAWRDILIWTMALLNKAEQGLAYHAEIQFERVGVNAEQVDEMGIPENPERPGTYQWEALDDKQAYELIERAGELIDVDKFSDVEAEEEEIRLRLHQRL